MADATPPRYGDFPTLFSGFPPDQPVDLDDLRTRIAMIAKADGETRRRLYPPELDDAHRPRAAEAEAAELADLLLGPQSSHPDIPDSPAQR
jgi:hypothetical protein